MVQENKGYNIVDGVLMKYTGEDTDIIIPQGVISIAPSVFRNNSIIKTVTIPEGVTTIGDSAFRFCKNLVSIHISNTVTSIGENAFAICSSLENIELLCGIKTISSYAFYKCDNLKKLIIPECVESIGSYAFAYCISLMEIIIPSNVKYINLEAFSNCKNLSNVIISEGIISIDKYAFRYCINLANIILPRSLISIGAWAFYNCTSLARIVIPESLIDIGNDAFAHCIGLENITVEENNKKYKSIEGVLMNKEGTILIQYSLGNRRKLYIVPNRVTNIGRTAFYNSVNLVNITLGEQVEIIGNEAFRNCQSLETIIISRGIRDGLMTGGTDMFTGCNPNLKILVPSESISAYKRKTEFIPYYTRIAANIKTVDFWGNNGMIIQDKAIINYKGAQETILIPNYITTIMPEAFIGKASIKNIIFEDGSTITNIGEGAFRDCVNLIRISLPSTLEFLCDRVFLNCRSLEQVVIPNSIKIIGDNLFENCIGMVTVKLPNSITTIGDEAFCACTNLRSINIPANVNCIGKEAFRNCINLEKITIDKANNNYSCLDDVLYSKDGSKLIQYTTGRAVSSFTIPEKVKEIGEYAFAVCNNLNDIIIPENVTKINTYSFAWCSNLASITLKRKAKDEITAIQSSALRGFHTNLKIYVPSDSIDIYRKSEGWREYSNIIFGDE